MSTMSSRPTGGSAIEIPSLTVEELQLISAFLYCTILGAGVSPYRDAAYSLMTKIEDMHGSDFTEHAAIDVDLVVNILDTSGNVERKVAAHWLEFVV